MQSRFQIAGTRFCRRSRIAPGDEGSSRCSRVVRGIDLCKDLGIRTSLNLGNAPGNIGTVFENLFVPSVEFVSERSGAGDVGRVIKSQSARVRFFKDYLFGAFIAEAHHGKPLSEHLPRVQLIYEPTADVGSKNIPEFVTTERRRDPDRILLSEVFSVFF